MPTPLANRIANRKKGTPPVILTQDEQEKADAELQAMYEAQAKDAVRRGSQGEPEGTTYDARALLAQQGKDRGPAEERIFNTLQARSEAKLTGEVRKGPSKVSDIDVINTNPAGIVDDPADGPIDLPTFNSAAVEEERKRALLRARARGGRASTILNDKAY